MHIDVDQVRRIAELARLGLADGEAEARIADLESILDMVDRMQTVDTDGVEPLAHPLELTQRLRPDAVTETDQRTLLQAGAPQVRGGLYLVPRVLE